MRLLPAAAVAVALLPVTAATAAAPEIGYHGVGKVKVGAPYKKLHRAGLVGRIRPGCELETNSRVARLKAPLVGTVNLRRGKRHRVRSIQITGGSANYQGAGIGATQAEIQEAWQEVIVRHDTDETFGYTRVIVPLDEAGTPAVTYAVDVDTKQTIQIGLPRIEACE